MHPSYCLPLWAENLRQTLRAEQRWESTRGRRLRTPAAFEGAALAYRQFRTMERILARTDIVLITAETIAAMPPIPVDLDDDEP